ncbi:MAG TPA: hypothetical protein VNP96_09315 [Solirubrobacterales bacterium]|nr:hypothetical protein [Solirubrobacterales bacterium]
MGALLLGEGPCDQGRYDGKSSEEYDESHRRGRPNPAIAAAP